jgi:probable poly-beta-1,6-N-acetyl-D-glucosamine export protein
LPMSRFLPYIHNLRGLAILFVVGVHAAGYATDWVSHPEIRTFLHTIFDPSEGNGTVLFLFIGGFLFQHLTHDSFNYRKFLEQKFLNIILPYILISIPLIIIRLNTHFDSLSLPEGFRERPIMYQFMHQLITGTHMPPFWFISTIVLFYLSSPILHAIDNRNFYKYFFPFVLLICLFTYRPEHNANPILSYIHFIPIYIMGMWASFNKERILALGWKLGVPMLIIYVVLTVAELTGNIGLSRAITFEDVINGQMLIFNIYMFKCIALCLFLLILFHKLRNVEMPLLEVLGHYSFGVFFVHYILISVFRKVIESFNIAIDYNVVIWLIYFTVILMTSMLTVYFVKKLTGRYSRYLIGS